MYRDAILNLLICHKLKDLNRISKFLTFVPNFECISEATSRLDSQFCDFDGIKKRVGLYYMHKCILL